MDNHTKHEMKANGGHYRSLAIMAALSSVAIHALMYAMVDRFANVHNSLNQACMAGLATSPKLRPASPTSSSWANFLLHSDMYRATRVVGWGELVLAIVAWWVLAVLLAGGSATLYNRSVRA